MTRLRATIAPISPPPTRKPTSLRDKLGICQWFHYQDYAAVDRTLEFLQELNVKHFRTGISWADYFRAGGKRWYDWQMNRVRDSGLEILLSVWHTPPSISRGQCCNSPPKRLRDYADFIDRIIHDYGDAFHHLELWNEPNNRMKWDFARFDSGWKHFAQMIGDAAFWAKRLGCRTVLGGMIPVDHHWLAILRDAGVLEHIDVVAIHAFPGMWFPNNPNWDWCRDWQGWQHKLDYISPHAQGKPIWVSETGLSTWDFATQREGKFDLQQQSLCQLIDAPGERFYFYSLIDLDPQREAIEGFHADENEYHMGLIKHDGTPKSGWFTLRQMLRGPMIFPAAPARV